MKEAAIIAAIHDDEHRLLQFIRRMDTREEMPGLITGFIRALEGSREDG
jgi:hypothetical protein